MLVVSFKPSFIKKFQKFDPELQEEVLQKIELFKDVHTHRTLRVHKLHGVLAGFYSFSVSYKIRIVFEYVSKKEAALLSIGDHEVYD